MNPRHLAFWMLAMAGVATGHMLGYAVAHPDDAAREVALGGHAYLPVAASVVVPAGVIAALVWAVRTSRELGLAGRIRFRHLALAQVGVFLLQEVGERFVGGSGVSSALTERGVWFGLVAQLLVAFVVVRAVDLVRRTVRFARTGRRLLPQIVSSVVPFVPVTVFRPAPAVVTVGSRAPPLVDALR